MVSYSFKKNFNRIPPPQALIEVFSSLNDELLPRITSWFWGVVNVFLDSLVVSAWMTAYIFRSARRLSAFEVLGGSTREGYTHKVSQLPLTCTMYRDVIGRWLCVCYSLPAGFSFRVRQRKRLLHASGIEKKMNCARDPLIRSVQNREYSSVLLITEGRDIKVRNALEEVK